MNIKNLAFNIHFNISNYLSIKCAGISGSSNKNNMKQALEVDSAVTLATDPSNLAINFATKITPFVICLKLIF